MAQQKEEYEETKKTLEEEASKLRQVSIVKISTNRSCDCSVNGERLYTLHLFRTVIFNTDVLIVAAKLDYFPSVYLLLLKLPIH